ncbi:hypothetical protein ABBQ32_009342 [Trebouxia sp. C0010 RCD-2024]
MPASRPIGRLESRHCALLVCDVQERFTSLISGFDVVVDTCRRMVAGASALQLPILVTEQYPKALGATKKLIQNVLPATTESLPKMSFSMCGTDTANWWASHPDIKQVMLCGIEAHVCVLQTALDLLGTTYLLQASLVHGHAYSLPIQPRCRARCRGAPGSGWDFLSEID